MYAILRLSFNPILFITCCSLNVRDGCGSTPLMDAVRSGDLKTIKLCWNDNDFDNKATTNSLGMNLLHIASEADQPEVVKYLVNELHFDLNEQSKSLQRNTALHIAYFNDNHQCVEMLLALGSDQTILDCNGRLASQLTQRKIWVP